MEFMIITGMSGAGKTSALHILEDIGYYCIDNMPSSMLNDLYAMCDKTEDNSLKRVAVVVDMRGAESFDSLCDNLDAFKAEHSDVNMLFFDAKTDSLVIRYKETRRRHPLSAKINGGSLTDAVELEKALLIPARRLSDFKIDTTYMSMKQLRERMISMFMEDGSHGILLTFVSFGFKYGIPLEADLIIDVRCLANPYYIPELKNLTGFDEDVRNYVLNNDETSEFVKRVLSMLDFSVPLYIKEGKSELVIGIGCTGGKHRSVTIAGLLDEHFIQKGYRCIIQHRDVKK